MARRSCRRGCEAAAWSPDGRRLVLAAGHAGVVTCDVGRPDAALRTIGGGGTICNVAWSPDGAMIAASEPEGATRLIDPETGRVTRRLPTHVGTSPNLLAFSGDGKAIVTDGVLAHPVWDVATGRALAELVGHVTRIQHVALSPDGRRVVTVADIDATVKVWDRELGADLITFWRPRWVPRAALFLPDGEALAVAWQDKDGYRNMELSIYRARPAPSP
ncbi:MAG: LpqB family beta-propeller domain-containing protein [Gemmataceae bacterium]